MSLISVDQRRDEWSCTDEKVLCWKLIERQRGTRRKSRDKTGIRQTAFNLFSAGDTSASTSDHKLTSEMTLANFHNRRHHASDESELKKNVATDFSKPKSTLSSANKQYAAAPSVARAANKVSALTKKTAAKFKKAPDAPKRFKSAFIFFSADKQKQIRAQMGDNAIMRTADMSKAISVAWKALLPDEKAKWEAMAHKDKVRYEIEKSLYNGPWLVPNTRKLKDANAPKRPMSAFLAFANSRRSIVRKQMSGCNNRELSRALAAQWKNAPEDVRQRYIQEEFEKRQAYTKAMSEWKKKAEEEKHHERQEREKMALSLAGMTGANKVDNDDDDDDDYGSLVDESNFINEEVTALESFAPSTSSNMQFSHLAHEDRGDVDNGTHQSPGSLISHACFPSFNSYEHSHQVTHHFPSADGRSAFDSSSTSSPLNHFPAQQYFVRSDPFVPCPLAMGNDGCTMYLPSPDGSLNQFPAQDRRASTAPFIPYPMANQNEGHALYPNGVVHHFPLAANGRPTSGSSSTLPSLNNQFPAQGYLTSTAPFLPYPLANQKEGHALYPGGAMDMDSADSQRKRR